MTQSANAPTEWTASNRSSAAAIANSIAAAFLSSELAAIADELAPIAFDRAADTQNAAART